MNGEIDLPRSILIANIHVYTVSLVIGPFCCKPISMRAMVLEYRDLLPILQLSNEECKLCIHGNIFQTGNESFPVKDFILRAK